MTLTSSGSTSRSNIPRTSAKSHPAATNTMGAVSPSRSSRPDSTHHPKIVARTVVTAKTSIRHVTGSSSPARQVLSKNAWSGL